MKVPGRKGAAGPPGATVDRLSVALLAFPMPLNRSKLVVALCFGLASSLVSCSDVLKSVPSRGEVDGLLRQEAETLKREGEADVNPALGVQVTWNIEDVTVREQPDNEAHPWAGNIRFTIESRTPELDGTATERFERSYDYVWDYENDRWVMQ